MSISEWKSINYEENLELALEVRKNLNQLIDAKILYDDLVEDHICVCRYCGLKVATALKGGDGKILLFWKGDCLIDEEIEMLLTDEWGHIIHIFKYS
jgi:hypothetical protein